jgi:hypothetical protein
MLRGLGKRARRRGVESTASNGSRFSLYIKRAGGGCISMRADPSWLVF